MITNDKKVQIACDKCTQGVMDATNPHLWGECACECHSTTNVTHDAPLARFLQEKRIVEIGRRDGLTAADPAFQLSALDEEDRAVLGILSGPMRHEMTNEEIADIEATQQSLLIGTGRV